MTDIQFITATKEFFLQYFIDGILEEKPSLLNMEELVEEYKQSIINDYENTIKNRPRNALSTPQDHNGPMSDDSSDKARKNIKIDES